MEKEMREKKDKQTLCKRLSQAMLLITSVVIILLLTHHSTEFNIASCASGQINEQLTCYIHLLKERQQIQVTLINLFAYSLLVAIFTLCFVKLV